MEEHQEKKGFWELAAVPIFALIIAGFFLFFYRKLGLPSPESIVQFASYYYDRYGLWVVFFGAIIEGTLLLGAYFPGSIVVLLGMVLAAGRPGRAVLTVLIATLGFVIASGVNYMFGKYGWYRLIIKLGFKDSLLKAEQRLQTSGLRSVFPLYYSPVLASFVSTSAGIFNYKLPVFFGFVTGAFLFWFSVWGLIAYFTGYWVLKLLTGYLFIIFLGVCVFLAYKEYKKQGSK